MCQIFINADPELYTTRSRAIRLHWVSTSLCLEKLFWQVLEEIAERDALSVPQLLGRLYDELAASGRLGERANFTSFLRVSCMRYQQLQLAGDIPADPRLPLRALEAGRAAESARRPAA